MVPTQQKATAAPSSAPTTADAAALAEVQLKRVRIPVPGCAWLLCQDQRAANPVGVGRYNTSKHEKYPQKIRYQSLYQCDAQRYLSNLERDAYLLERLKPVAKINRCGLITAPRCPDTSEEITFPKVRWCWKAQISK